MNCGRNSQLIQQLIQTVFSWTLERLLFVLANLAKEYTKLKILPHWEHVDNARELHHELRSGVERIVVGWIEDVDGPQVDKLNVI